MQEYKFKHTNSKHLIRVKAENSVKATQIMQGVTPNYKEWQLLNKQ